MAMFPIFMIGLIAGAILGYIFSIYRKETPSETKFKLQEAEIIRLKEDIKMLETVNEGLNIKLKEKK